MPPRRIPGPRPLLPSPLLDIVCPYLTYQYLRQHYPGIGRALALVVSGVFPALATVITIARSRSFDIIGATVPLGLLVRAVSAAVGGNPPLVLVRGPFATAMLAVVGLASLVAPRRLLFSIARDVSTGHDTARIAECNTRWNLPGAP